MRTLFRGLFTIYNFLIDPQRSRGLRVAAPWCVEHATLRSNSICWKLYTENLLEAFLRLDMQIQLRKYRSICFEKIAPVEYDYGCGRGSYGEAMRRWDMSAVGIDGDARIVRSYYQMKAYSWI